MNSSPQPAARARLMLLAGLFAVATSGPFFMMAKVSAFAAVFWRTLLAGTLALAYAALRRHLRLSDLKLHARGVFGGGLLLGVHFLLWVKAFELTDYASNLLLLVSQPIFAALLDAWTGQPLSRTAALTLALAGIGMALVAGSDVGLGPRALLGDAASLLAGVLIVVFFVVSRRARSQLPIDVFLGSTMLVVAALALPVAWIADVALTGYSARSWAWLVALVAVTTLGGHGLLNLAARSLPLFLVNLIIVLEPVIAIALGALLFGAEVTWLQAIGGTLLGGAVVFELRGSAAPSVETLASQ